MLLFAISSACERGPLCTEATMNELICITYDNKDVGEFLQWRMRLEDLQSFQQIFSDSTSPLAGLQ